MSDAFVEVLLGLSALDEEACALPWSWPGHGGEQLQVRDALYISLLEEQEAAVRSTATTEAGRILCLAQRSFGDLRGLLAGVPDDALDRSPDGEWSLREVLTHVLEVERSYHNQTRYASRRSDDEPVYTPQRPPAPAGQEVAGGIRDWIGRLAAARAASFELAGLAPEAMTRPTRWARHDVDIRFRLHRFAAHISEHTIQCEKALQQLGMGPREGWSIAREISAVRGAHELVSEASALAHLDRGHEERLRSIGPAARPA